MARPQGLFWEYSHICSIISLSAGQKEHISYLPGSGFAKRSEWNRRYQDPYAVAESLSFTAISEALAKHICTLFCFLLPLQANGGTWLHPVSGCRWHTITKGTSWQAQDSTNNHVTVISTELQYQQSPFHSDLPIQKETSKMEFKIHNCLSHEE